MNFQNLNLVTLSMLKSRAWILLHGIITDLKPCSISVQLVKRRQHLPIIVRLIILNFAFVSCQNWPIGFFTAYQHLAKDDLDLVVHLGDYIYEGNHSSKVRGTDYFTPEIYTLDDYRNRYALYKLDSDLQAAHANFPWIVTFDDHEVDNNWAGEIPQDPQKQSQKGFLKT